MKLIATDKHGYRPKGQVFEIDEPLGLILLKQGKAIEEIKQTQTEVKQKPKQTKK